MTSAPEELVPGSVAYATGCERRAFAGRRPSRGERWSPNRSLGLPAREEEEGQEGEMVSAQGMGAQSKRSVSTAYH